MPGKRTALSTFLREKRASVKPGMVGLPEDGNRRVPGLRREEVAALCGVSIDWYVRLEQGRQVTPSESVLHAIARTLRLDDAEREYLFNLARHGGTATSASEASVRPGVHRMIAGMTQQAAFVLGPRMEVLAGNDLAWALLGDFPARDPGDRNLLRWIITDPAARRMYLDWASVTAKSATSRSTPRSGSTWMATRTSSGSGRATTATVSRPSTG